MIKTSAVVLKSFDFRETSRIATFFTSEKGKVKAVLKGIRKDPRKFGSGIDQFSLNELVYYEYRRSDLHLVSQCDLTQFYFPIRENYRRSVAATYALELIDRIMPVEEANEQVFCLLLDFLDSLQREEDIDRLVFIIQIKLLQYSGFSPHLDSCVKCDEKIVGRTRFSMQAGGLVCPQCPTMETTFNVISQGTIASILHIERSAWPLCLRLGLPGQIRQELKYILNNFLVHHLERDVKTARMLT